MDLRHILLSTDGAGNGAQHIVNGGGAVIPPPDSQRPSEIGVHWLRCSLPINDLDDIVVFVSALFGNADQDGFGLWSYTDRYTWSNGASLNYDSDPERSDRVHAKRATLDVPGRALDDLTVPDLALLIEFLARHGATCSRIDTYFDDYSRIIEPKDLQAIIETGDYSGFRQAAFTRSYRGQTLHYDCAMFGGRGGNGNGKYLRVYDKYLESKGKKNCIRWEAEFSQGRANEVFKKLAATRGDLAAFATICGTLIAGCITFVKRTGEKNIKRLDRYEFWTKIVEILGGEIRLREKRKHDTLTGKVNWIDRAVAPSLACLQRVFRTHEDFFHWLWDILDEADGRMNVFSRQIAQDNAGDVRYDREHKKLQIHSKVGIPYVKLS